MSWLGGQPTPMLSIKYSRLDISTIRHEAFWRPDAGRAPGRAEHDTGQTGRRVGSDPIVEADPYCYVADNRLQCPQLPPTETMARI